VYLSLDQLMPMSPVEWYIIVNPAGGNGSVGRAWPSIRQRLSDAGFSFTEAMTKAPMHAMQLVEDAVHTGFRKIIAVGGDGTNHEVINGMLLQQIVPSAAITYVLLPVGTGNDWIRSVGIPSGLDAWIQMVQEGHRHQLSVGKIRYQGTQGEAIRYFINVAGLAYDGYIASKLDGSSWWMRSRFIYLLMVFVYIFKYVLTKGEVSIDNTEIEDFFYTINIGIGRYSGGGMQLVPHANPKGDRFGVTLAGRLSKIGVLMATPYFYNGKVEEHPKVSTYSGEEVEVRSLDPKEELLLEADGEPLGTTPAHFSLIPEALTVICKADEISSKKSHKE
jgi:diacylglycerol kinase (ATP)